MRGSCLIGAWLAALSSCLAQTSPPAPFSGTSIPAPPQQKQAWTPPQTQIPPEAVSAMAQLFDLGLANPRGCEYREIEVAVGSCWGASWTTKTHGWILPSTDGPKFAVCWNGLVYPLVSSGAPADLHTDVAIMLKKDKQQTDDTQAHFDQAEKLRNNSAKLAGKDAHHTDWPIRWNSMVVPEDINVSWESMRPMKAPLLLCLGENELADQVWTQWFGVQLQQPNKDPYLMLATDWTWALFERAICAHMVGDDHLSLIEAQLLTQIQPDIETQAAAKGIPRPSRSDDSRIPSPYITFLDQLPALLADQQRRVQEAAPPPTLQLLHPPQGKERITALIRDLELVSARQTSQPGGVDLASDPIVQGLIQSGPDAVEPLLDCLENDTRLTRSVRYWRDFAPNRTVLGVHEAAYVALAGILQTDFFSSGSTSDSLTTHGREGRLAVAEQIRAYWQKYKNLTPLDRWLQTLSDDRATPGQWLEAASNIVQDSDVQVERGSMMGGTWTRFGPHQPGVVPPMRGEPLRAKTNPSVSDLLVKRMHDLSVPTGQVYDTNLRAKTQLAEALAKWDGHAHLGDLREMTDVLKKRIGFHNESFDSEIYPILQIYQARITAGDPDALKEYATWVVTLPRERLDMNISELFELLWKHPTDPAVQHAVKKLFSSKDSPWVPLIIKQNGFAQPLLTSPMLGLASFRDEILLGLKDTSPFATASIANNSYVDVMVAAGWTTSGGSSYLDPSAPPKGTLIPVRACDLYAHEISLVQGAPKFQFYWPVEKRDQAILACAQFLKQYGDLLQYQPSDENDGNIARDTHIHFPHLDRVATPTDVAEGRAIFSLEGDRRVWKMPAFPMKASWTTLKDNPQEGVRMDGTKVVAYNTEGSVFQVEEVLTGGKWERFYGFVGANHIAKVSAAEIEFPAWGRTSPLSMRFDCILNAPGHDQLAGRVSMPRLGVKDPLPFNLKIRNHSGLDQAIPGTFILPPGDSKNVRHAVDLKLDYSDQIFTDAYTIPDAAWKPVPLKDGVSVAASQAGGPTLAPTAEFSLLQGDLRDYFDLTRPGTYRLQVSFTDAGGVTGKSEAAVFIIAGDHS